MNVTVQRILIVLAVVLFVIAGAAGAGWIETSHPGAFLGFGLASFAAGHLP